MLLNYGHAVFCPPMSLVFWPRIVGLPVCHVFTVAGVLSRLGKKGDVFKGWGFSHTCNGTSPCFSESLVKFGSQIVFVDSL